jgi:chromosome segregation ATPase
MEETRSRLEHMKKEFEGIMSENNVLKSQTGRYSVVAENSDQWKKRYLTEIDNVDSLQQTIATLVEENRCHVECISALELKINTLGHELQILKKVENSNTRSKSKGTSRASKRKEDLENRIVELETNLSLSRHN